MRSIPFQEFKKIYEEKVESIYKHWTREMQTEMSFHCYGWDPASLTSGPIWKPP